MTYTVITSQDSQFDGLKNAFNQRWMAPNLLAVYLCASAEDVVMAL